MISKQFFSQLFKEYEVEQESRETIIRQSRDLLRLSKQAIFSLHREDVKSAAKNLKEAGDLIRKLAKGTSEAMLESEGSFRASLEEYLEANFFFGYLKEKTLQTSSDRLAHSSDVLGALADLSGELVRYAIKLVTQKGLKALPEIESMKDICEEIVGGLMNFHLTGKLRSKQDDAKRNLKRMEEILYDLNLKRR